MEYFIYGVNKDGEAVVRKNINGLDVHGEIAQMLEDGLVPILAKDEDHAETLAIHAAAHLTH